MVDSSVDDALQAVDAWAKAGDLPTESAPERWAVVLQYLIDTAKTRPVGLDAFLVPLA